MIRDINISLEEAQQCAYLCCGENAPQLDRVTDINWISERNKFLSNVSHNGAMSHTSIINVLLWFNRFNTCY